jgi:NADH-quinone oxidoreductase subunit A
MAESGAHVATIVGASVSQTPVSGNFLLDFLPIIIFIVLAAGLGCAFMLASLAPTPKRSRPMSAGLTRLTMRA